MPGRNIPNKKKQKSKAAGGRVGPGRPAGSGNTKSAFIRDEICSQFRCSQGFNKTVDELLKNGYKSKADIMHEALQILAARKLPGTFFFINKIQ